VLKEKKAAVCKPVHEILDLFFDTNMVDIEDIVTPVKEAAAEKVRILYACTHTHTHMHLV
jgi:hypothetical protein